MINPPEDLYAVIASEPLIPDQQEYRFPVVHRHPGEHEVRLSWPRGRLHDFAGITLQFIREGRKILAAEASAFRAFSGPERDGVILLEYQVPRDVPIGTGTHCELVFAQPIDARMDGIVIEIGKAGY